MRHATALGFGLVMVTAVVAAIAGRWHRRVLRQDVIDEVSRRERMRVPVTDAEIARWIEARKAERAGR